MSALGREETLAAHTHRPLSPDARLSAGSLANFSEPGVQPGQVLGNRLPYVTELINVAIEANVSDCEPIAGKPWLVHDAVQPAHARSGDLLLRLPLLGIAFEP